MRHEQDPLHPTVFGSSAASRRAAPRAAAIAVFAAFGLAGCKKDKPAEDAQAASEQAAEAAEPTDPAGGASSSKSSAGGGPTSADGLMPATQLQRGSVLGHVLLPNASGFLGEIKAQVAPQSTSMFLDEGMLRGIVSGQLGARQNIAKNVDLSKPMGCALVDTTVTDLPVACIVGYTGGTDAIVGDLGAEGKQSDAGGHAAHYKFSGQDIYIDALDGHVVLTNHTEVFASAKDYLQSNMIARADKVVSDVEAVAYVSSVLVRYRTVLQPVLELINEAQSVTAGGGRFSEAMSKYNAMSTQNMIDRWGEMEQLTIGFGMEPAGFVLRYAVFAVPGSRLAEESQAAAAGSLDPQVMHRLPRSAWLVAGASIDWPTLTKTQSAKETRKVFADAYAAAVEKDPEAVNQAIDRWVDEAAALYGNDVAYALLHEPGTVGAALMSMRLADGKTGRDGWKAWTKEFTPDAVLDAETRKKLTWSFAFDAYDVGGVPVDRWVIEPTPSGLQDLRAEVGPQLASLEKRLGGLRLVIDRAEVDGRVLYLVSPTEDKSMSTAIEATKGQGALADDAALADVLRKSAGLSGLLAVDVRRAADWLRELMPADAASRIPATLGQALSDVTMATSHAKNGNQSGELVISQPFIDQLRALAD
jgi:hypothetical protein